MEFRRPQTLEEALALLATDGEARCLAGGQSLVPMINLRLVEPTLLVSLRGIEELGRIVREPDGTLRIGAMVTHAAIAAAPEIQGAQCVIAEAARQVGHPAIRNFGTLAGSLCHADPAADPPVAAVAAGAVVRVHGPRGERSIPADDFFVDYLTTALEAGEIVTEVAIPPALPDSSGLYYKYARVDGDYATVSVALALAFEGETCSMARIALGGCARRPLRLAEADARLVGSGLDRQAVAAAARLLQEAAEPMEDVRGSASYRRRIIPALVERAVERAVQRHRSGA